MPEWFKDWWPVAIVVIGAVWAAYTYFDKRRRDAAAKTPPSAASIKVTASGGSVAGGRDVNVNTTTTNLPADDSQK